MAPGQAVPGSTGPAGVAGPQGDFSAVITLLQIILLHPARPCQGQQGPLEWQACKVITTLL